MKHIALTRGQFAQVDDEDFGWLNDFKWYAHFDGYNWYASTKINGRKVLMHRLLLAAASSAVRIDHRDHDGLNNRKDNLRYATGQQNSRNMGFRTKANRSGFKGVSWKKRIKRWVAQIKSDRGVLHLGTFSSAKDAAVAYDAAAVAHFGEFAATNKSLGLINYEGDPVSPRSPLCCKNTSGLIGVSYLKQSRKWLVRITIKGKRTRIGMFADKTEAALAYDKAAVKNFGPSAVTNQSSGFISG